MATRISNKTIDITPYASGGNIDISLQDLISLYIITGTVELTGSVNIQASTIPTKCSSYDVLIRTGITLDTLGALAIEGKSIGVEDYDRLFKVIFDGTNWGVFEYTTVV